jgi:dTDP-4-dehydrorhamnose reductase
MKVFVTGVNGQLGHDVVNELVKRGHTPISSDITEQYAGEPDGSPVTMSDYIQLDITDNESVRKVITSEKTDAVIHCAAWTNVDAADDEANRDKVFRINAEGTRNIAESVKAVDAKMVYISTDYVFSGLGDSPWSPDCKDFAPLNVYGESKLGGESAVSELLTKYFIVRIAWVFGKNGKNFIKTMLNLSQNHDTLRVVDDQIGTPTYTYDLSRLLVDMIETDRYGYYHATNEGGYISWAEFAKAIFEEAHLNTKVIPVTTSEYGLSKAKRPLNSRLDKTKLATNGFHLLPTWRSALRRYLKELEITK